jgi:carbonic anhydrase
MVVIVSCEKATSPVDINQKKIMGPCSLKCDYNYNYGTYTPNITNKDDYLSLNYTGKSNPVKYNDLNYEVVDVRIYHSSLHQYNGVHAAGEILIIHGGSGKNLIVSIPFQVGSKQDKGSEQLGKVLSEAAARTPTSTDSVTLSIGDFSLGNFIPDKKAFYSYTGTLPYTPCNGTYQYIVYSEENSLNISEQIYKKFKNITQSVITPVKTNNVFYNKNGANLGNKADDIYIDCQPVGSDGQLLVNESVSADSMGGGDIDMEKLEPFLWVIVAIIGAVAISKGIEYVLNHFKKNKSN